MRINSGILFAGAGAVLTACILWSGCGGDDGQSNSATISGNVSSVNPPQARLEQGSHRWLARLDRWVVGEAIAQSSCPALHLLVCASNGIDPTVCAPVDSTDCTFAISLDTLGDFSGGGVSFGNDTNQNGQFATGEQFAILTNPLVPLCNGTVAHLNNVAIDFSALTATAASVVKDPDTCAGTPTATARATATTKPTKQPTSSTPVATNTPLGGGIGTPTATGTQNTTPTTTGTVYAQATSLNRPPSNMLALLSGAGVVGLLLPRRRRKGR